ncbi:MAG: SRPBCC domain-containing protein [Caulobacteraceae bacterium]|nr:SRPBCC domain-containing protein [Caulobacteraceae bacterium]
MKSLITVVLAAAMLLALPAVAAPSWKDFPGVENTSFTEPNGDKVMQLSIVAPAPRAEVWKAFATSEGYSSWATPLAAVDLEVDGMIETSYQADARLGAPDNIKNQITAYVPGRMLALRNVQSPPGFPGPKFREIAVIVELEDAGPGTTKVTLTGVGYKSAPDFQTLYGHFEWGNAYSLAELKKRFETGPVDWADRAARARAVAADRQVRAGKP